MDTIDYRNQAFELYDTDMEKAVKYFTRAANHKDIPSAVALAAYYYEEQYDEQKAKEWLEKAIDWFEKTGKPEEYAPYIGSCYYLRGLINEVTAPYLAAIDFADALDYENTDALIHLGKLAYKGYESPTGEPEINKALEYWKYGMELQNEECARLYEEHKMELVPEGSVKKGFKEGTYTGQLNEQGLPHGNGHMDYKLNGYWGDYYGEWRDGKRCGKGKYKQFNKAGAARHSYEYIGEWLDDKEHGQGKSTKVDEVGIHLSSITEEYTGEFRDGKGNGQGVLLKSSYDGEFSGASDCFEGEFQNGGLCGHGTCHYANGNVYEGEFVGNRKHGHGVYTYADGLVIEGNWDYDELDYDSFQCKPASKTPTCVISTFDKGFDFSHGATFLVMTKVGDIKNSDAILLKQGYRFDPDETLIKVIEINGDSVTYEVDKLYFDDKESHIDTIRRGEKKSYKSERDACATIYDEDYDYTIVHEMTIVCR